MCFLEELNINDDVYQDVKNINRQYDPMIRFQILDDILQDEKWGLLTVKRAFSN